MTQNYDEPICGVISIGGTGLEWICIKPIHGEVYKRRTSGQRYSKGDPFYSTNPSVDQHYFVRRYQNRNADSPDS
jgi:hypothetical protein